MRARQALYEAVQAERAQLIGYLSAWGQVLWVKTPQRRLELLAARSLPEVLDRLANAIALRTHQTFEPASARLARRAVALLEGDEVRVGSVAERLGVTARHLHRAFTESIGIGPKDFARTVRLQPAMGMAATSKDWARIAADAGYYDQAHLIADFRELIGLTPGAFLKRAGDRGVRLGSGESEADLHGTTERLGRSQLGTWESMTLVRLVRVCAAKLWRSQVPA